MAGERLSQLADSVPDSVMTSPMVIGGTDAIARDGGTIEVRNPAQPTEIVGTIPRASAPDVDDAVRAARAAFAEWRATPLDDRTSLLHKSGDLLAEVAPDAAITLTREMGKILAEAQGDVANAEFMIRTLPGEAADVLAPVRIDDDFGRVTVRREPLGVVGIIVPWNWPNVLLYMRVAEALATGNTVVCLPSPYASLSVLKCARALAGALPPGVLNVVTGLGVEAGAALTAHTGVEKVSFTGSIATGIEVLRSSAGTLKRTGLELGGNDPAVILEDVAVNEELGRSLVGSAFTTTGQVCFAIKRVYVARPIYADVLEVCLAAADEIVVGDGLDPRSTMGPLVNRPQLERFDRFVDEARERGAHVLERGTRLTESDPDGYFRQPSIVTGADETFTLVNDEQFGPALPIMAFDKVDEAVSRANASPFGLGASVWSADGDRARAVATRVEAGMVFLNRHDMGAAHPRGMFGGVKQSGIGRELGRWGLEGYTELRQIVDSPS